MKRKQIIRRIDGIAFGWIVSLLFPCCTQEQLVDCPHPADLDIEVVNVEGEDITDEGSIETLSLYIFDNRQKFLKIVDTRVGESLSIYFPDQDTLHVVSWGNLSREKQHLPQLAVGTPMSQAVIKLNQTQPVQSKAAEVPTQATTRLVVDSPDDLFYSYDIIALKSGNQTSYKLQMNRTVGSMSITLRNLKSYANRYDDNYSLLVRETYDAIDFNGRLTGDKVGYRPPASFNAEQELVAPLFHLLPSLAEGKMEIDIYHASSPLPITTVKTDSKENPLKVERGQVLNVLVDFQKPQVSVEVSVTPWGVTKVWKDF